MESAEQLSQKVVQCSSILIFVREFFYNSYGRKSFTLPRVFKLKFYLTHISSHFIATLRMK